MTAPSPVLQTFALGFPWPTFDPFLFCAHHDDAYPAGTPSLGVPPEHRRGRHIGMDFTVRDGFRMYHGSDVPGFPAHPHCGFETVTLARHGFIDHSDSLGATARFGEGDVQWITTGAGLVHSEMFPLVHPDRDNRTELFQIWLNLPREDKGAPPHFQMHWAEEIPKPVERSDADGEVRVTCIAGSLPSATPPSPPPRSWAARDDSDVAIWLIRLSAGARWVLPAAQPGSNRALYIVTGDGIRIDDHPLPAAHGARLDPERSATLHAPDGQVEVLILQGRPIGEPVVQQGPFVATTPGDMREALLRYRETGFGGWPWGSADPTHGPEPRRFARLPDGRTVTPPGDDPTPTPGGR